MDASSAEEDHHTSSSHQHYYYNSTTQSLFNDSSTLQLQLRTFESTTTNLKMSTSHIETSIGNVDAAVVIAALHNHELMIKTLCPALISYEFESGDKATSATYTVTDKKPIGQVRPTNPSHQSSHSQRTILTNHRPPTSSP